jgi:hypothetical protein
LDLDAALRRVGSSLALCMRNRLAVHIVTGKVCRHELKRRVSIDLFELVVRVAICWDMLATWDGER